MGWTLVVAIMALGPGLPHVPSWAPEPHDTPPGACKPLGPDGRVHVDWDGVPLTTVARVVGCALERNIVFQPAALGTKTVTLFGARPFSRRELARLWTAVLADAGLVGERHGAYEVVRGR
jgi:hypothetical protein